MIYLRYVLLVLLIIKLTPAYRPWAEEEDGIGPNEGGAEEGKFYSEEQEESDDPDEYVREVRYRPIREEERIKRKSDDVKDGQEASSLREENTGVKEERGAKEEETRVEGGMEELSKAYKNLLSSAKFFMKTANRTLQGGHEMEEELQHKPKRKRPAEEAEEEEYEEEEEDEEDSPSPTTSKVEMSSKSAKEPSIQPSTAEALETSSMMASRKQQRRRNKSRKKSKRRLNGASKIGATMEPLSDEDVLKLLQAPGAPNGEQSVQRLQLNLQGSGSSSAA